MKTTNDVMKFLNQMELFNIESGLENNTFIIIRKILIDEYSDIDLNRLVELLGNLDNFYIEYIRNKLYFDKSLITTLRIKIFEMCEQKIDEENRYRQIYDIHSTRTKKYYQIKRSLII